MENKISKYNYKNKRKKDKQNSSSGFHCMVPCASGAPFRPVTTPTLDALEILCLAVLGEELFARAAISTEAQIFA